MKILRTILLGVFVVAALAYLNIIIPAPQKMDAKTWLDDNGFLAQQFPNNTHPIIKVVDTESPRCQNGSLSNVSNYGGGAYFTLGTSASGTYKVHIAWASYFCATPSSPCLDNKELHTQDIILHAGDYVPTGTGPNSHAQNSCGNIQTDMAFVAYHCTDASGSNCPTQVLAYGNLDEPGQLHGNATYTYCNTGVTCPAPTHKTCQNNACVTVNGAGTSTCTGNSDCQPQNHNICQNNACVQVAGPGANTCNTVTSGPSSECSHLTCQSNSCVRVTGAGENSCSSEGSSCGEQIQHKTCQHNACILVPGTGENTCGQDSDCQTHKTCQDNACKVVAGPGENTCRHDPDCQTQTHKACVSNACSVVNGPGASTCGQDSDCQTQTHKACVSNACALVVGGGNDSCGQDSDCVTPTHKACVSQACTLVMGSGSDSCGQDSDCHVDTCSGTNCGNINITVEQHQQQQQQQAVLGASVAPASNASNLPSTGAGADVLFGLLGLLPVGLKLRKLI